jgi:hypothetical protein
MLTTDGDGRTDWLIAGQALGRVLLELTDAGGAAQPLTQALDITAFRQRVRSRLRLVGHPQMIVRLGTAQSSAVTPRRPLEQVIVN